MRLVFAALHLLGVAKADTVGLQKRRRGANLFSQIHLEYFTTGCVQQGIDFSTFVTNSSTLLLDHDWLCNLTFYV